MHRNLIDAVLPRVTERSKPLADFLLLGSLLTHHGLLADSDPGTADKAIEQIDWLRASCRRSI